MKQVKHRRIFFVTFAAVFFFILTWLAAGCGGDAKIEETVANTPPAFYNAAFIADGVDAEGRPFAVWRSGSNYYLKYKTFDGFGVVPFLTLPPNAPPVTIEVRDCHAGRGSEIIVRNLYGDTYVLANLDVMILPYDAGSYIVDFVPAGEDYKQQTEYVGCLLPPAGS